MNKLQKVAEGNILKDFQDNVFEVMKNEELYSLKNIKDGSYIVEKIDYDGLMGILRYTGRGYKKVKSANKTLTNREYITHKLSKDNYIIGCYDDRMDTLAKVTINRILESASYYDYTDVLVTSKGKKYIVEITTVDNERDFIIITPKEYENKYGRKYGEEN